MQFSENPLNKIVVIFTLIFASVQAAMAADVTAPNNSNEAGSTEKAVIPHVYKDYSWDIGVIGGMTFDGIQTDAKRTTIGAGIKGHYHLTEYVGLGLEYMNFFKSFSSDNTAKKINSQMFLGSVTFDFTPERTYSLYAIANLGYERLYKEVTGVQNNPVLLAGFGFRYLFADSWSANLEGRMKIRLRDMSGDNGDWGLVGTLGLNYHF